MVPGSIPIISRSREPGTSSTTKRSQSAQAKKEKMENSGIGYKQLMAEEVEQKLKDSAHLFISSFNGIALSEQDQLRRQLKEIEACLFVAKNRIFKRVFQKLDLKDLAGQLKGLTAITMGGEDPVSISRALVEFAGKNETFKITAGYVDKQLIDSNSIKRLASIPSKEVLLTQLVYGFNSPIQGLVNSLSATIKKFIVVVDRIRQSKPNS